MSSPPWDWTGSALSSVRAPPSPPTSARFSNSGAPAAHPSAPVPQPDPVAPTRIADARDHETRTDGLRSLRRALSGSPGGPRDGREIPTPHPPEADSPEENLGDDADPNDDAGEPAKAPADRPSDRPLDAATVVDRPLDAATVVRLFHTCSASLARALADPHPAVHAEACLAAAALCAECDGESMRTFSPWVARDAWPTLVAQLFGPRVVSDRAHMCMVACLGACRDPKLLEQVADAIERATGPDNPNPLAATRLLDKVARILGDWPSGALLDACKPHAIRAIDAGMKHGGLAVDGARKTCDDERRDANVSKSAAEENRNPRRYSPRRRTELLDPGAGGGCVDATLAKTTDSHPSTVAVRVAAKAAFDVFEAAWPKHAERWVRGGMEPRWRRLVTHGVLETPEESGAYARGGYPSVPRGRTSATVAEHEREEAFAERQREDVKRLNGRSADRDPDASEDVDARRLTIPGNFRTTPFQPPYAPLRAKPVHKVVASHPKPPPPKPLWVDPPSPVRRKLEAEKRAEDERRGAPLAEYYEAVRSRGGLSARECGVSTGSFDPNDVAKTAEESALYRDLRALDARMENLRVKSVGARMYEHYAEAFYRPGGATESSEVSARRKVERDRETERARNLAARARDGADANADVDEKSAGVVERARRDAERLGADAGAVPGYSLDAAGRLRRITRPSLEPLRTAGVCAKTPPKTSLATAALLGLPNDRVASPGTKGIDEHGATPSRTTEERARNLARIRAELAEFRRDLDRVAAADGTDVAAESIEVGPWKRDRERTAKADAAFEREVAAANEERDELRVRKAAAVSAVERHRIQHALKVKKLARENLEFEERMFREAEDERVRKEAEHAAALKALAFKARMETEMAGTYALSAEELLAYPGPPNPYELGATSFAKKDQNVEQPALEQQRSRREDGDDADTRKPATGKAGPKAWGERDKSPAAARAERSRAAEKERHERDREARRRSAAVAARVSAAARARARDGEGLGGGGTKEGARVSWDENLERTELAARGKPAEFDSRPLREKVPIGRSY